MPSARSERQLITMLLLFNLMQLVIKLISRIVGIVVVNICFPTVPPRNWNNKVISVARIHHGRKGLPAFSFISSIAAVMDNYVDLSSLLSSTTTEAVLSDVPALIEFPKGRTDIPEIKICHPQLENNSLTVCSTSTADVDFSIYSDASSPKLNKAKFITPPRSSLMSAKEFQLSLLKAASERVSEILRENRRRLDAGEDPNIHRKEARRRRAQELSAVRNNRDSF